MWWNTSCARDPTGVYPRMDFASRDHYRHEIEQIAKESPLTEVDVARQAIELTKNAFDNPDSDERAKRVGFIWSTKDGPNWKTPSE